MRSTLLLAALAAGAVDAFEKHVYVTDWTTVTVTETVTAPAVTLTVPAAQQNQQPMSTSLSEATTPTLAPQVSQAPTAAVEDSDNSDDSALAKKSPAPEAPADVGATTWFSAWTTTWGAEAPTSTLATSSSAPNEPAATPSTPYQEKVLYNHNIHRTNHSAPSLEWSDSLKESARKLASQCVYHHDTSIDGGHYGQNIGYGTSEDEVGKMLTNLMYNNEIGFFDWHGLKSNKIGMHNFDAWGHFTQIIWKATTHVGCATVVCPTLGNAGGSDVPFTVCNYSPAGNMAGEYRANIAEGLNRPIYVA